MSINVYLREHLTPAVSKRLYTAPNIDEKKLNNAIKAFAYEGSHTNVIALLDSTVFGSGKDGLLFTGEQLIYRGAFADPIPVGFSAISSIEHLKVTTGSKQDKIEHSIVISLKDGSSVEIKALLDCDYALMVKVLQGALDGFEEFKEERQLIPIDEMEESVKVAYLKVIVNAAHEGDGLVDEREFAEILLLMTRLDLAPGSRFALRSYMTGGEELTPLSSLLAQLDRECPSGQVKTLHVSLAKDLLNLHICTGGVSATDFGFLSKYRAEFQVTDADIELAVMALRTDRDMLTQDMSDDQIVGLLKLLSAKAAAVGTPLAAVYLSGSVMGLSAAGLSSGLAALGMGGFLGLSSMTTGIGVAVLIGVGAYTGMRKLTGANELTRAKYRELMLNEVIKQTQATISLLIQDINYLAERLTQSLRDHGTQSEQIRKLMALMQQMTSAGAVLTSKTTSAQGSAAKLRCAQYLDETKLRMLTREPTKAGLFEFIRGFYESRSFTQTKDDGETIEVLRLAIKPDTDSKRLEDLARAFEAIGYFNVSDVLKGTAAEVANKAKDKLTGLFS
jgi:hypothetical protein